MVIIIIPINKVAKVMNMLIYRKHLALSNFPIPITCYYC